MASLFSPLFAVYNRAVTAKDRNLEVTKYFWNDTGNELTKQQFMGLPPDAQEYDIGRRMEGPVTNAAFAKTDHVQAIKSTIQAAPPTRPGGLNLSAANEDRYRLEGIGRPRNNAAMTHTMGDYLGPALKEFEGHELIDANFWEWVEQQLANPMSAESAAKRWNPVLFSSSDPRYHQYYVTWLTKGVKYLAETNARDRYKVEFRGDDIYHRLRSADTGLTPLDKTAVVKHFTDKGKPGGSLIWVLGEGKFYSHMSKIGRMHHSSFFAGKELEAAGEWDVEKGKLKWISGQSGHYRPDLNFLDDAVKALPNAVLSGAQVRLFRGSTIVNMPPNDFLRGMSSRTLPSDLKAYSS